MRTVADRLASVQRVHAWNDGFYAVVSARRESVSGASKRYVFTAVGRSGLGLHFPFSGIFTQPPLSGYGCSNPTFAFFAQILLHYRCSGAGVKGVFPRLCRHAQPPQRLWRRQERLSTRGLIRTSGAQFSEFVVPRDFDFRVPSSV